MSTTTGTSPELIITRIFHAPRELVWQAWADPKQMIQWMGPRHHPATQHENDFRVGGTWRSCLTATDGSGDLWVGGVYHEIIKPERLVFTFVWDGDDGKPENEMWIAITLIEEGAGTKMTLHQTGFRETDQRDGHNEGWTSCLDRLEDFLGAGRV